MSRGAGASNLGQGECVKKQNVNQATIKAEIWAPTTLASSLMYVCDFMCSALEAFPCVQSAVCVERCRRIYTKTYTH